MSKPGTDTCYLERVTPDGIAIVTLDHYPVNSLSTRVFNGIATSVMEIEKRGAEIKGVVVRGAGRCFCAGADISAFGGGSDVESVELDRESSDRFGFEELNVPVVAAIHGLALGGGMEVSLGAHYRVLADNAFLGLPEVNIGLLPGAQGTQRTPRLIGSEAALDMITTGKHIPAAKALKWGLVDELAPVNRAKGAKAGEATLQAAIRFCKTRMGQEHPKLSKLPPPAPADWEAWKKKMAKKRRGEPAPLAIIECIKAASEGPTFQDGVDAEMNNFMPLIISPESVALRYMFFKERSASKVPGLKVKPQKIRSVGIVGAGLMGGGIAMCCANVGIKVMLLDVNQKGLDRGLKLVEKNYARSVKRRPQMAKFAQKARANITGTIDYGDLKDCDLVVEAVFEDMSLKKKIFKTLDQVCKPSAILCSNTSYLDIDAIAAVTSRPEQVMGAHFFSPANVMKLLENVRGKRTSDATVATLMAWGKRIGKWAILVGNCDGFVGNRMVTFYGQSAREMLLEGATPKQIDDVATAFGMRMGPLAMSDLVGLDLGMGAYKKAGKWKPELVIQHGLVELGRKGQKTQSGFFDYENRRKKESPVAIGLIRAIAKRKGVAQRKHTNEEIVERLFYPMINEGFKILQEGIAMRPSDIDVCYVHGYSFPRYRGGPMHWADKVGLHKVKASLEKQGVAPAKLLTECVANKSKLAKYWKKNGARILKAKL